MTYEQLIGHFGTAANAARALGYEHRQRVQKWKLTGVPREEQALIEIVTGGALVADIAPASRDKAMTQAGAALFEGDVTA